MAIAGVLNVSQIHLVYTYKRYEFKFHAFHWFLAAIVPFTMKSTGLTRLKKEDLKRLWKKEKMLENNIFSFSLSFFYPIKDTNRYLNYTENVKGNTRLSVQLTLSMLRH